MKKIIVGMAMLAAAGSVYAENSHQAGAMALGFTADDSAMITGKYMLDSNLALTAGAAFATYGGDADGTDFGVRVGVRSYMNSGDFSPFIGGRFGYISQFDGDVTTIEFVAEFGAEYFLAKNFSVEGTAGFGYRSTDDDTVVPTYTENRLGTERAGVGFNFYF